MGYSFLTADVENAFWQVPIQEEAYLQAPKEWIERQLQKGVTLPENVVWKLKKEWYGRRIAGQAFVEWTAGHLKDLKFERNPAPPWLLFNASSGVVGPYRALVGFEKELHGRIKMKSQIHMQKPGEKFTHLNRTREIHEDGIFLTPRSKYITDLLNMLGLSECNEAPTPYMHSEVKDGKKLTGEQVKLFRAGVGLALYSSPMTGQTSSLQSGR